jgi:hypothetical protein
MFVLTEQVSGLLKFRLVSACQFVGYVCPPDQQVKILTTVAQNVPVEKHALLLERTAALMKFRSRSNESFREAVTLATVGAFAVAIGSKADMTCCAAYVCF